jgi:hypothetical protein
MSQLTFAWRRSDGVRKAYRARVCTACFVARVAPLAIDYPTDQSLTCPSCHIGTDDDYDALWITAYMPSYGAYRIEAPFCGACAAIYRGWVLEHAWELEDQLGAADGPQTHPTGDEVLRSMGISPRVEPE